MLDTHNTSWIVVEHFLKRFKVRSTKSQKAIFWANSLYFCSLGSTKSAILEQKVAFEDFIELYSNHFRTVSIQLREMLWVSNMLSKIQKIQRKQNWVYATNKKILDTKKRRSSTFSQLILTPDSIRWDWNHDVVGVSTMKKYYFFAFWYLKFNLLFA